MEEITILEYITSQDREVRLLGYALYWNKYKGRIMKNLEKRLEKSYLNGFYNREIIEFLNRSIGQKKRYEK